MTIETIKQHIKENKELTPFEKALLKHLTQNNVDDEDLKLYIKEVITYGCAAAQLEGLYYTQDILKFYNKYGKDIEQVITIRLKETNLPLSDLILGYCGRIRESEKIRMRCWYAIEETLYNLNQRIRD